MTKADAFRVLRMEGGVGGLTGGKRHTGTFGQSHWNHWLSQVRRPETGYAGYQSQGTG